LRRSTMLCVQ